MRYTSIAVSAMTALTLFSPAVTGAAIRRNAAPSGGYTLTYTTDQGQEVAHADDKGSIDVKVKGLLISVAIDDKDDIAQCIVKDKNGYQIRKLGGKDIEQTFIEFEDEDGKQAKSIVCAIGEEKPDGGKGWEDVKEPPKEEPSGWKDSPEPVKPSPPPKNEWMPHPVPESPPPPPPITSVAPPPPKETGWKDAPEPVKPSPPPKDEWQPHPVPESPPPPPPTTVAPPPPPPTHEAGWQDHTPAPPPPPPASPPKKDDWEDKVEVPKPEPPKQEQPKEQSGWGDNAHGGGKPEGDHGKPQDGGKGGDHGKPQDGGHGGDHGKPQEDGDKPY